MDAGAAAGVLSQMVGDDPGCAAAILGSLLLEHAVAILAAMAAGDAALVLAELVDVQASVGGAECMIAHEVVSMHVGDGHENVECFERLCCGQAAAILEAAILEAAMDVEKAAAILCEIPATKSAGAIVTLMASAAAVVGVMLAAGAAQVLAVVASINRSKVAYYVRGRRRGRSLTVCGAGDGCD